MNHDIAEVWSRMPAKVDHPYSVAIVEALWWIAEPLSAIVLVDVFDGYMSMWDAAAHLHALERLGVVEPVPHAELPQAGEDRFDMPYRLIRQGRRDDG